MDNTTQQIQAKRFRRRRTFIAVWVLLISLVGGFFAGAIWISGDDVTWQRVFTTPPPTLPPTPEIALPYTGSVDNSPQPAGYYVWELADLAEWLIENNSTSTTALQQAAELLEAQVTWERAEHPVLDSEEQAAVERIREKVQTVVFNRLESRNFEICFLVHPDEGLARILELGLHLSEGHSMMFLPGTRFVAEADFERYLLLERYERSCTSPPPPEKR